MKRKDVRKEKCRLRKKEKRAGICRIMKTIRKHRREKDKRRGDEKMKRITENELYL